MKRDPLTWDDLPAMALEYLGDPFVVRKRCYTITDVYRDPRTEVAITVAVMGPDGMLWMGNPNLEEIERG